MAQKKNIIKNNPAALARYFGTEDPVECFDRARAVGWEDKVKLTLFREVAHKGTPEQMDAMIERGLKLDEDIQPYLGRSALHYAAEKGNLAVIRHLVENKGVSVDLSIIDNGILETPLEFACYKLKKDAALLLLKLGAKKTPRAYSAPLYGRAFSDDPIRKQQKVERLWNALFKAVVPLEQKDAPVVGFGVMRSNLYYLEKWLDQKGYSWPQVDRHGNTLLDCAGTESRRREIEAKIIGLQTPTPSHSSPKRRI